MLILSSYLAWRFSANQPLSLAANLTFEQSYGPAEGDSASVAELCALLSVPAAQVDAAVPSTDAISFAVRLAARFKAGIDALLLVHDALTRGLALPFATAMSLLSGLERPLSASRMDRSLPALCVRVQATMAEPAASSHVRWPLRVTEEMAWQALIADAGERSLLVIGHEAHHLRWHRYPTGARRICVVYDEHLPGQTAACAGPARAGSGFRGGTGSK